MAFVAIEAHGQEELGRVLHRQAGLAQDLVVGGRRVLQRRPGSGQDGVDELIVRHVACHRLPNPIAERQGPFLAQVHTIDLQQVSPFVRPILDVFRAAHQCVDQ